jgi:hypothetical protein
MPRGRPANPDKKIADLVVQLRKALVARERALVEAHVTKHVDSLVAALHRGESAVRAAVATAKAAPRKAVASMSPAFPAGPPTSS